MVTPTEYGLALAAVIAILFFVGCCSDTESADDKGCGCGCCLAAVILLLATLYLIYFFFRFTASILSL